MYNKRSLTLLLCVLCAAMMLLPANAAAAESAETVTVYFTGGKNIRTSTGSTDSLGLIQPYQPVILTPMGSKWGLVTLEDGTAGYVFLDGMVSMPDYEWLPETRRCSTEAVALNKAPSLSAKAVDRLNAWELCVADGRYDGWIHIRIPGRGVSGYVPEGTLRDTEFPLPENAVSYTAVCGREAELTALPLSGAEVTGRLPAGTLFTAYDAGYGDRLMIRDGETVSWVSMADVCACAADEANGLPAFIPFGKNKKSGPEIMFRFATVESGGADLTCTDGSTLRLEAGERVMVCYTYGGMAAVTGTEHAGFVAADSLKTETAADKAAYIRGQDLSGATVEKNAWLDAAFSMLEEDNSLLLRYNAATGSDIRAVLPLGVPYFWGGRSFNRIRGRLPEYNTTTAWQSSRVYYRAGKLYLTGFDCVGFVKTVCRLSGHPVPDTLGDLVSSEYHSSGNHVWCRQDDPLPDNWKEAAAKLETGDILVLFHPGQHVMLCAGTLRQYGYTEENLPAAAEYLDNPLMIQCGEDPFYYLRMTDYIRNSADRQVSQATPPDGGVNFCILGVPYDAAEYVFECHGSAYPCFLAEGTCINIYNFDTVTDYAFYR